MSILTAYQLTQTFDQHTIFHGLSAKIEHGNKIGLVGPNGVGKSSLLRILAGIDQPSAGRCFHAGQIRLGYLHQEAAQAFGDNQTSLYSEMLTLFSDLRAIATRLAQLEQRMATGEVGDDLFADYADLQATYEGLGGYTHEVRIEQTLQGLGFAATDWETPICHLSGGQQTRALLARLLLEEPDLLILDEPTNHLDIEALAWLETTLQQWPGTLLVVSHDRSFLDTVANLIWELSATAIESYRGNYSAYSRQRVERWERRQKEFDQKKERLDKEMAFVYKHMAGRGHRMAQGKLHRISTELNAPLKLANPLFSGRNSYRPAKVKAMIQDLARPDNRWQQMQQTELTSSEASGKVVLQWRDLVVGYDEPLFVAEDIELERGSRVALIGPNGTGKTTLMRTLLGELTPLDGEVQLGHGVRIGYFAQIHETLNPAETVLQAALNQPPTANGQVWDQAAARQHLAKYLFRGDEVFKQVGVLSGGERGRLCLALLALQGANFLLLDEPTNHLDLPAQEVLQTMLEQFDGTILLISHDRYLVTHLATTIWSLRDGCMTIFDGDYTEFIKQ